MWKKRNNNTKKNVKGGEIKKRIKKRRKIEEREKVVNRGEVGEGERRCRRGAEEERRGEEQRRRSEVCVVPWLFAQSVSLNSSACSLLCLELAAENICTGSPVPGIDRI